MRRLVLAALVGCASPEPVTQPETAPPAPDAQALRPDLDDVRDLLREYHHETRSSSVRFDGDGPPSARQRLLETRPIEQMVILHRARDPVIHELGGAFWGLLAQDLKAAARFFPLLLDDLYRKAPRARAFACEALGYFGEQDARPHLEAALQDREPVPGYTEGTVVADFAERALELLDARAKRL